MSPKVAYTHALYILGHGCGSKDGVVGVGR